MGVQTRFGDRVQGPTTGSLPPAADQPVDRPGADGPGYGPLQQFFDDDTVEEIWINDPGRVFVARHGRHELTTTVLSEAEVRLLVERMLRSSGRRLDLSSPFVDAALPDGSRLHVVIPDITRAHWAVNIRRFVMRVPDIEQLVSVGTLSSQAGRFLLASIVAGLNLLIAGSTQAGKTTLLTALLAALPGRERIISCEEVFEIHLDHGDWVAMQTRDAGLEGNGEVTLRRLVREAMRMRPTRLVVGEVRGAESLDLLTAMNAGMPALATIHANSAREAIAKLCTLPLLAGPNVASGFVVPTVAASLDLVVHTETTADGRRRVSEVVAVTGEHADGRVAVVDLFGTSAGQLVRGDGSPGHAERFRRAGYDLADLLGPTPAT